MASKLVGIVGATGTGKSTSIKHLDPKETYIINTAKKELPFKGAEKMYNVENKNYKEVDDITEITRLLKTLSEKAPHIKNVVIEDSNYMMAFRMADKANEVGFQKFTTRFNLDGLLRGDIAARSSYYTTMRNVLAMSPNEIRIKENMNPYEGGDSYDD